ncbi:MAG: serine/threonine protein kinase [Luteolibacter sp.]
MSDQSTAAAFVAPELEEVARLFPNYEIVQLIACGGMGAVYEATQTSLDRQVAIKILPREFSSDQAFREGFESEAKAMAKLNHPNLIGVYDFGEADGMLFIVMEYVPGNSLFASSNGNRIDPSVAISIIEAVCHGLTDAHAHGILHRDIKPSNILLDQSASPKIGDFGLARALEREIQEGEQIFGTPGYTAPEVLQPPFAIDQRADIFSVGVMLHELLTGQLPDADPRTASQICGCSFRLDAIIRKATHKDPRQRYTSCAEMAAELAKVAALKASGGLISGSTTGSSGSSDSGALRTPGKYVRPKPTQSSSGLGFIVFFLVIAAAIAFFVMNQDDKVVLDPENPPESKPESVEAKTPTLPPVEPKPVEPKPAESGFDAQALLDKLSRDINRDMEQERIAYLDERREIASEFGKELMALAETVDAKDTVTAFIARIDNNDAKIPGNLPGDIEAISGAGKLHSSSNMAQRRALKSVNQKIRECKSYYIIELENAILKNKGAASSNAVAILQSELDRVNAENSYFRDNVVTIEDTEEE